MFAVGTAVQACELRIGIWDERCEHGCIIEVTVAVAGVIGAVCRAFEYQCAEQVRDANHGIGIALVVDEPDLHAAFHCLRAARHGQHRRAGDGRISPEELGQVIGDQQVHDVAVRRAPSRRAASRRVSSVRFVLIAIFLLYTELFRIGNSSVYTGQQGTSIRIRPYVVIALL